MQQEPTEDDPVNKKRSNHVQRKVTSRKSTSKADPHVEEQFLTGRLYGESIATHTYSCTYLVCISISFLACVASRPGQSGRCDGYVLEGKELEFYLKKLRSKKAK